jgi:hypothetical protein
MDVTRDPIRPSFGWFLLLDGGLAALAALCLLPGLAAAVRRRMPLPSDRALRGLLIGAIVVHLGEGTAAYIAAKAKGRHAFGWAVQTAVVGFPSLRLLAAAEPV